MQVLTPHSDCYNFYVYDSLYINTIESMPFSRVYTENSSANYKILIMSLFPFFRKISTMASKLLQDDGEMFMDRIQNDRDIKRPKRKKVGFWPEETDFIIT